MINYLRSRVAASPGMPLADLLAETTRHGLTGDCIYAAIVTGQIYVNLSAAPLAEPERARVYFDESNARLYQDTGRHAASTPPPTPPHFSAGSALNWDGKTWEVVNQGKSQTWLKDDAGSVISLSEQTLSNLLAQGSAQVVAVPSVASAPGGETAEELLARASAADLAEANRRYALLSAYRAGGWNSEMGVSARTLRRWEAGARQAEAIYQCGFIGLLPHDQILGQSQA